MAITKLNSLAIPDNTIIEADLSYPLTNFSSTGIDDNATSTAITIDSSENVGIGTDSPSRLVEISEATGDCSVQITSNSAGADSRLYLEAPSDGFGIVLFGTSANDNDGSITYDMTNREMLFRTADSNNMTIDSSGNVGIGTAIPTDLLSLESAAPAILITDSDTSDTFRLKQTNTLSEIQASTDFAIDTNGSERFRIDSSGNLDVTGGGDILFPWNNTGTYSVGQKARSANMFSTTRSLFQIKGADAVGGAQAMAGGDIKLRGGIGASNTGLGVYAGSVLIQGGETTHGLSTGAGEIVFYTGGTATERMRVLSSGGITFNGDTAAANALDDYEEGTFTLTLGTIYGGSPNFSNSIAGRYVKIGKIVHCEFQSQLNGSNAISVDDRFGFSGLPFGIKTNQAAQGTAVIHASYGGGHSSFWNTRGSGTTLLMWCHHEDGAVDYGDEIIGSLTYETS